MDKLEFVDTHVHFYDMQHPELVYGHWQPGVPHETLGEQIQRLAERNYLADDYIAETRNANVTKAVHVQAAIGSPDPVTETEWLQEAADRTGFPHGIVAHADLRDPGVEGVLERHCRFPNMRGIRDFSYGDYLVEPDFHRGFGAPGEVQSGLQHSRRLAGHGKAPGPGGYVSQHHDRRRSHGTARGTHGRVFRAVEGWHGRSGYVRQHPLEDLRPRYEPTTTGRSTA